MKRQLTQRTQLRITYIFLRPVHLIPAPENLIVDLHRCSFRTQVGLDVISSASREQEERSQWALGSIGIALLLRALLLLLASNGVQRAANLWHGETSAGKEVSELLGVEDSLVLARGVQQRVGMGNIGADECADRAIELGEARDDCWWLAKSIWWCFVDRV